MAYVINRYNGATLTTVEDGTVDQTLDIKLIGKNYAGYGEIQNENFVHILENFANSDGPANAIVGQIWYDSGTKRLRFFAGDTGPGGQKIWKTAGGVEYGTEPSNPSPGDVWYDTATSQLKVRTPTVWQIIGPPSTGDTITQLVSRTVRDTTGNEQPIIVAIVDDLPVYIISKTAFEIDTTDLPSRIAGYINIPNNAIKKGITLPFVNITGESTDSSVYWGTASNATRLAGFPANTYVRSGSGPTTTLTEFGDAGFTVGNDSDLFVFVQGGNEPTIRNQVGANITFQTQSGAVVNTPLVLAGNNLEPGLNVTSNIGTTLKRWSTVFATVFDGTATAARYADLAEKYLADQDYEVGTVVSVGGSAEVTASTAGDRAIGVVSANPAFMMNKDLEGGTYIALKGRVPVKVVGPVKKGQRLTAADNGTATAINECKDVFAVALEDSADAGVKLVEAIIL
jgi:hypothetical protein